MKSNTKEKNNNQINKLNLPTTWTKKKMMSLFLMTWLSANGVEAGQAFENCMINTGGGDISNAAYSLSFASLDSNSSINNEVQKFCCSSSSSSLCVPFYDKCGNNSNFGVFYCNRISQKVFCLDGYLCCGGIENNLSVISNNTGGNCSSYNLSLVANHLSSDIVPHGLNMSYAQGNFSSTDKVCPNLRCSGDNGGWTCNNGVLNNDGTSPSGNPTCYLQGVASSPTSTNGLPTSSASESSNSSKLPLYIGVSVGGVVVLGASGVVYGKSRSKGVGNKSNEEVIEDVKKNPKGGDYKQVADAEENMSPGLIRSKSIEQKGTYIDVESGNGKGAFKKDIFNDEEGRKIVQALGIEEEQQALVEQPPLQHH